jgi:tRNA-splicing ligase RtcB
MALAQGEEWSTRVPEEETLLSLDSELGQRYWNAMHLAGLYAHVGREYVARKTVEILGGAPRETVHNHHNFAWKERHFGEDLVVVRKGSTPAFPEQKGFVGGSMGDNAYIVQGVETTGTHVLYPDEMAYYADVAFLQQQAMFSTVHGAGRVMSRSRALGSRPKRNKETGEVIQKRKGEITRQMMSEWVKSRGVIVRGGDVDESPHCYRRLNEVLAAQGDTIEILHTLRPLVVVMAGADVIDPYKD